MLDFSVREFRLLFGYGWVRTNGNEDSFIAKELEEMRVIRMKKRIPYNVWGCPKTKNRSPWCHAWCTPQRGVGACGRIAPHALMGITQQAILSHKMCKD